MQVLVPSWQNLIYLDQTEHDVLCRILTGGIHIDALTPKEMLAVSNMRVQCGLEPIEGIEELLP